MKTVSVAFMISVLTLFVLNVAEAQDWQTVYQTDFSSDPGWTTNDASLFYWDSSEGTYRASQYNIPYGGNYAFIDAGYDGGSFLLEWDIIIDSSEYASDLCFGLFDPDMNTSNESFVRVGFTYADGGHYPFLQWRSTSNLGWVDYTSEQWSLDTWYHVAMVYDSDASTLSVDVSPSNTRQQSCSIYATDVGPFDADMGLVGTSNVRDGDFQVPMARHSGMFDNIAYSLQNPCGGDDWIQLTTLGGFTARWSPDGSRIVFTSIRDEGNSEIYVMNSDGTDQTRLTCHPSYDKLASWHPDGVHIVFVSTRYGNHDIYTMNADSSCQTPDSLIVNPSWDDGPFWSPDASKLLFESDRDGGDHEVYTIYANGTNLMQLTDNSVNDGNASWSPTGEKICFTSDRDGNYEIYVMDSNGDNQVNLSQNLYKDDWATWSPDGDKIVFMSDRDGNEEIYIMDAVDGSNQTRLTYNSAADEQPQISPDGQWLLFHSDRDGTRNIYKIGCWEDYICGDCNGDGMVDIDDVVCLIEYIFAGGPAPVPYEVGDVDCSGGIDIDDVVYLINYIFGGGPAPCAFCETGPFSASKTIVGSASLSITDDAGDHTFTISLTADRDVQAVQLEFAVDCDVENVRVESLVDGIEAFYGYVDGVLRIGLLDLYGTNMIPDGHTNIVRISHADMSNVELTKSIIVAKGGGHLNSSVSEQASGGILPIDFALNQNHPNPFNPTTEISFSLPTDSYVKLAIFNIMGQRVSMLVDDYKQAGNHTVTWNGQDDIGASVASGVYFYRIEAGDYSDCRKMLLMK